MIQSQRRRLPRWLHRIYARVTGHYWTRCPKCGTAFGGHERRDGGLAMVPHPTQPGRWHRICPTCTAAGLGVQPDNRTPTA